VTELDAALVRRKLAAITRDLSDLERVRDLSLAEYRDDRFRKKAAERLLQEAIEAAVDANLHVLRAAGHAAPSDYFGSFVAVGRAGILSAELAEALAPSAGLRNRLVHEYDEIDDRKVLEAVGSAIRDLGAYVEAVEAYLEREGV
jgi:uncharacterized protein YutE (UPF0331/DUF86 family)